MTIRETPVRPAEPRPRSVGVLLFCVRLVITLNWIIIGIFALAGVVLAAGVETEELEVPVPVHMNHATADPVQVPRLLHLEEKATVFLGGSDPVASLGFVALLLVYFGFAQYGFYQVRGIVRPIGDGRPFDPQVPRRFVRLSLVFFVGWPVNSLAALGLAQRIARPLADQGLDLRATLPDKNLEWLIAGLFCLVLALAFRAGEQLQAEQDLTV